MLNVNLVLDLFNSCSTWAIKKYFDDGSNNDLIRFRRKEKVQLSNNNAFFKQ